MKTMDMILIVYMILAFILFGIFVFNDIENENTFALLIIIGGLLLKLVSYSLKKKAKGK